MVDVEAIKRRYRRRADVFEATVAAVAPDSWTNASPCAEWDARGVVDHVTQMNLVMLRGVCDEPELPADDPLSRFRIARWAVERVLDDPGLALTVVATPTGPMTAAEHVAAVVSDDMVFHRWDLARATGQDDTIDPVELSLLWPGVRDIPEIMRTPGAFGAGIVVFGPEVRVDPNAPLQDRLLGKLGRDPQWAP